MNRRDFSDLEDQIMNTVKNALNAIDFANLKKGISDKADDTLNEVKSKLNEYNEKMETKYASFDKRAKSEVSDYISKRPVGSISGILYIVFGSIASVIFGLLLIISLILTSVLSEFLVNSLIGSGVLFMFFVVSLGLSSRGINLRKRVRRFKKYVKFLDDNSYCLIKDLASLVGEKDKFVAKDLKKMIELGMFTEGHIDEEKTYFILNNKVYENYLNLRKQQIDRERLKEQEEKEQINNSENEELKSIIKIGKSHIEQIRTVRNELYKEDIAIKLDKLQNVASQILNYIEKNPKKLQEVNKFINNYLPITIKLVNSYKELNNQTFQGDNIKSAKNEIEKSIGVINNAFENLLDDLFEDVALDISTDISVLKTLFTQEGLTDKEDFKK